MADGKSPLSQAQIQYLKIGPKIGTSQQSKKLLMEAIAQQEKRGTEDTEVSINGLNKVPKLTYGEFEKTVNNFGVLLNKNFGSQSTVHQMQKFGKLANAMNKVMIAEKDKPMYSEKKNILMKKVKDKSDNRTFMKSIYDFQGQKIYVVLKSFNIQTMDNRKTMEGLPIPYLRFLVSHVNSSRLAKIIEGAIKNENNIVVAEYEKMEGRASHLSNSEVEYQKQLYSFQRMGQQLKIILPSLEFAHVESGFQIKVLPENKEILEVLDTDFDNVADLFEKYVDVAVLRQKINTLTNQQQLPAQQQEGKTLEQVSVGEQQQPMKQDQDNEDQNPHDQQNAGSQQADQEQQQNDNDQQNA